MPSRGTIAGAHRDRTTGAGGAPADHAIDGDEVAGLMAEVGVAGFIWDGRTDRFRWSANAAAVLGVAEADMPRSARALQRMITPATAPARTASIPPIHQSAPPDDAPKGYRVVYALSGAEGSASRQIEEVGCWLPGSGESGPLTKGCIRVFAGQPNAASEPSVDGATGLILREGLLSKLGESLSILRQDRQGTAAFLIISIDGLARINASFGYEVGDAVIATVAKRIAGRMRQGDVLGHVSGHKFGAILGNCSESMLAFAIDRFVAAMREEPIAAGDAQIAATVSIGAVVVPRTAPDAETAAVRAEEALFEARAAGGDGAVVYAPSPERDRARRRNLALAEEIVQGLADNRFVLAYQPVVDARSGHLLYHEALMRLVRRDGAIAPAGDLIATAERLGLIGRIDVTTLDLALADLHANPGLRLSVNVSVTTALGGDWMNRLVAGIAEDRSIAPRLTVEITETAAMSDLPAMRRLSQTLRDLGCKIAIDDYGVGHTSLKALRDMEIDWVKIDGSYIADIATNPDSLVFVKMLIGVADHFGIATVAEWIENEDSARILRDLGAVGLQGRHVGMPRLRVTPRTAGAIAGAMSTVCAEGADGYRHVDGVIEGEIGASAVDLIRSKRPGSKTMLEPILVVQTDSI